MTSLLAPPSAPPPGGRRRLLILALVTLLAASPASAADQQVVTAQVHVSPVTLGFELSASTVRVGQATTARATVINETTSTLRSIVVTLRFEPIGLVAKGGTTTRLTQLKGDKSADALFQLCGTTPGAYVVLTQVQVGSVVVESPARLLVVTAASGRQAKC